MIKEDLEKTPAAVFPQQQIENLIYEVRGVQVMLDRDLAQLYEVEVGQMNRQVKRNKERFPEDFMFQLSKEEWDSLKCHFGISKMKGGDRYLPYVFTEQGVSALSGILRSEFDDDVYHFGASIKDLGKRWFGVNLITEISADELIGKIHNS